LFGQFPFLKKLFADSAYAGPVFHGGLANVMPSLVTEIVRLELDSSLRCNER
jgi:hypothetical protein